MRSCPMNFQSERPNYVTISRSFAIDTSFPFDEGVPPSRFHPNFRKKISRAKAVRRWDTHPISFRRRLWLNCSYPVSRRTNKEKLSSYSRKLQSSRGPIAFLGTGYGAVCPSFPFLVTGLSGLATHILHLPISCCPDKSYYNTVILSQWSCCLFKWQISGLNFRSKEKFLQFAQLSSVIFNISLNRTSKFEHTVRLYYNIVKSHFNIIKVLLIKQFHLYVYISKIICLHA